MNAKPQWRWNVPGVTYPAARIPGRRPVLSDEQRNEAIALVRSGAMEKQQVAARFGVSPSTISRILPADLKVRVGRASRNTEIRHAKQMSTHTQSGHAPALSASTGSPLYAERDPMQLDQDGGYYCRHVHGMTKHGLHSKADIAAELAWRDREIDRLRAALRDADMAICVGQACRSEAEFTRWMHDSQRYRPHADLLAANTAGEPHAPKH